MPDLDDIFEDIFDGIKKLLRKQKKRRKKNKKRNKEHKAISLITRFWGRTEKRRIEPVADVSLPSTVDAQITRDVAPHSATLRNYLHRAQAYQQGIVTLVNQASSDFNRARLADLTRYTDHWQNSLAALVQRVDQFQQNALLQQDMEAVPKAIARLETQLAEASSAPIQHELARTLANRQQQLAALENLHDTMQWAEIKIENTVSMLGTIYSQALMSQSKGQVANYRRLLAEVEEEARGLDDYVAALAEVKLGDAAASPTNQVGEPQWKSSG